MSTLFTSIPVLVVALVLIALLAALLRRGKRLPPVRAKGLLTNAEQQFMTKLEMALPAYRVLTQVAMGALLQPKKDIADEKERLRARNAYSQKIVDFVIADRHNCRVVAIVELDDKSHEADRDARRDAMLESAGYSVVRFSDGRRVGLGDIQDAFRVVLANSSLQTPINRPLAANDHRLH